MVIFSIFSLVLYFSPNSFWYPFTTLRDLLFLKTFREVIKKKNGKKAVRLTAWVGPLFFLWRLPLLLFSCFSIYNFFCSGLGRLLLPRPTGNTRSWAWTRHNGKTGTGFWMKIKRKPICNGNIKYFWILTKIDIFLSYFIKI